MKLIVQIPCFNEEATLAQTVAAIPREIPGVDVVEILVIDDGSRDRTVEVARAAGVDHVVSHKKNQGLARTFRTGLDTCLRLGADIIVNTDGDNQYSGADIPLLIQPILAGRADVVVGDRQTHLIPHFSRVKKLLQTLGSALVRSFAGVNIPDAVSGFRAISRESAIRLNIVSSFSYTTEMLIQAGKKQMAVTSVPVATNPKLRESRLFRNIPLFIASTVGTILRTYAMYKPLRIFFYLGLIFFLAGLVPVLRFLVDYFADGGAGYIQSLVLGGVLIMMGFITMLIGLITDLISSNRQLIEMVLERVKKIELDLDKKRD